MKIITLRALCLFVSLFVPSQLIGQVIRGTVINEKGGYIPFANIVLRSVSDSSYVGGTLSDEAGQFLLQLGDEADRTRCFLEVRSVGYAVHHIPPVLPEQLQVQLSEQTRLLQEVWVRAPRAIRLVPDGRVINVKLLGLQEVEGVFSLLGMLPGLSVRGEAISVVGRGTPLVYVNGREVTDLSLLSRYDSKDIVSVKIITNPGVRYGASTRSVLEIKTRNPEDGLGGRVSLQASQGRRFGLREFASLVYKQGAFDYFLMLSNRSQRSHYGSSTLMELPTAQATKISMEVDQEDKSCSRYLIAGVNYTPSKEHSLGLQYDFTQKPKWEIDSDIQSHISTKGSSRQEAQHSHYSNKDHYHSLNAYYLGTITPSYQLRYDMNLFFKREEAENKFSLEQAGQTPKHHRSDLEQRSRLLSARLQHFIQLGQGQLTLGNEAAWTRNKQRHVATLSTLRQADSKIENQLYAAFASYTRAWGSLMAELGLRYEYNKYDYHEAGVLQPEQSKAYHYLMPSVQVALQAPVALSLSYQTKTKRPSYHLLSDRHQYNNEYLYEGGNRYLLPQNTQVLALGAQWQDLQAAVEYQHLHNAIYFYTKYDPALAVALSKPYNIPHSDALDFSASWSPRFGLWRPSLQLLVHKPFLRFEGEEFSDASLMASLRNFFLFRKQGLNFSMEASYFSGGSQELSQVDAYWQMDLSISKTFFDQRLRLSLSLDDAFNTGYSSVTLRARELKIHHAQRPDGRRLKLTLNYSFNMKKNRFKGEDSSSELQRL